MTPVGRCDLEIAIRAAVESDASAIAHIYNEGIALRNATFDSFAVDAAHYDEYFHSTPGRRSLLVAVSPDQEVVGWTAVSPRSTRWAYRKACVGSLYVRSGHRHQGIGDQLKVAQITSARELGYSCIILESLSTNPLAIPFNRKHGFVVVGVLEKVGFRDGKWINLNIMQLTLQDQPSASQRVRIGVKTDDINRSIELYRDAIGLDLVVQQESILQFSVGAVLFEVCHPMGTQQRPDNKTLETPTKGVVVRFSYDTYEQLSYASKAAIACGVVAVDSGPEECSFRDFNGLDWRLDILRT